MAASCLRRTAAVSPMAGAHAAGATDRASGRGIPLPARESGAASAVTGRGRTRRCYFCGKAVEGATGQRVAVCGRCPDSALWQAIWRESRRER